MSLYLDHLNTLHAKAADFLATEQLDALILTAGMPHFYYDDDIEIPHKMPASLRHWIPENIGTHQYLVITKDARTLYSHRPKDFWLKVKESFGPWSDAFTLEPHESLEGLFAALNNATQTQKTIWLGPDVPDEFAHNIATQTQKMAIDSWRLIKTEFEIECMKLASIRAASAHVAVRESLSEYISEFQMNLDYLDVTGLRESELPYGNIIAYNDHGSILHYQDLDQTPPAVLNSFLIDAGAVYDGYIADITRTHPGEDADPFFITLLKHMRAIKLVLIDECKAGVSYMDIHRYALKLIGELLIEHQFIVNIELADAVDKGIVRVFFPHGIGHLLGLNTHDTPSIAKSLKKSNETFKTLRLTQSLQNNMVLTIEPGIYFNDTLITQALENPEIASHLNLERINPMMSYGGIRDEDNIVICDDQPRNLTAEAFAEIGAPNF
ncbi:Xaa-Pro dipeptidase [Wohlfahrtiimonas chitiniclastica]|uniref:Xaa-Pro dipeptidase n=1 Tax=Wohlfahrtiimonas chitiniclastica TaxID=400946 RepID=UPI0012DFD1D2|nr:Xaa-Pro dipeptidase [Wohlfahrtiimonas chitiniclastica]